MTIKAIISEEELHQISAWLENDFDNKAGAGLFANWKFIKNDIESGKGLVLLVDTMPVGFLTYSEDTHLATINFIGIDKRFRKSGFARHLITHFLNQQKTKGKLIVDLFASPVEMRSFWKKLGFIDALKSFSSQGPRLYQQLVAGATLLESSKDIAEGKFIQLWKNEPYQAGDTQPDFTWQLDFDGDSSKLTSPIISSCLPNWKVRYIVNGEHRFEQKITKFKPLIYFNDFLIINQT